MVGRGEKDRSLTPWRLSISSGDEAPPAPHSFETRFGEFALFRGEAVAALCGLLRLLQNRLQIYCSSGGLATKAAVEGAHAHRRRGAHGLPWSS
jgi:hypothetical protein